MNNVEDKNITEVLTHWGLAGEAFEHIYTSAHNSSWNVGNKFILRKHHKANIDNLTRNIRLANLLLEQKIPTVAYVKTLEGEWTTSDGTYCVMAKLKGEHFDFYKYPDLAIELGKGLAQLHLALSNIENELQYNDYDFLAEWNNYIKAGLVGVSEEIIMQVETQIFSNYKDLPRTPIHRDVHSENVLFCDGKISGWLDFDLSRKDARIFDLAYFLAGLLVGHINDPEKLDIWKEVYRNLLVGYNELSKLSEREIQILPNLMIAIELLFVTYWNSENNEVERDKANELAAWLYSTDLTNYSNIKASEFWNFIDELIFTSKIVIDRPKGSRHPKYPDVIYPLDYGYLENTMAMDGGGIDVWKGSNGEYVDAIICTVDLTKRDSEIKILIGCTEEEKQLAIPNNECMKGLLVRRRN